MNNLELRWKMMMGASGGSLLHNFYVHGNPTINGNIYKPDNTSNGFIYVNKPFNPSTIDSSWIIQVKIKVLNPVAWSDIIASTDVNGNPEYMLRTQFNDQNGACQFDFDYSSNGEWWNYSDISAKTLTANQWTTIQLKGNYNNRGIFYFTQGFPPSDWSAGTTATSGPLYGKYISFGGGSGTCADCEIDLSETKIWINDVLWWEAI